MTLTVKQLKKTLDRIPEYALLEKNSVGNLAILDHDTEQYIGWINLRDGEVDFLDDDGVSHDN